MYTANEIKIANLTSRTNGASAKNKDGTIRAIVPKYIKDHIDHNLEILDYGAGKDASHTIWLRNNGFNKVTAYDFGNNIQKNIHDINALNKKYDVIFASNVLNVQSSNNMMVLTVTEIYDSIKEGGTFIANYPSSPRKSDLSVKQVSEIIENIFNNKIERIGGTASAPMWKIIKSFNM